MNAVTLIQTLILTEPQGSKLETANQVLNELHRMRQVKGMPFLTIRRAIKMQGRIVNGLK